MSALFLNPSSLQLSNGRVAKYFSIPGLEAAGLGSVSRLPVSIRIVLESVLRNCDGKKVSEQDVRQLAAWNAKAPAQVEIPFVVARIVLQDFTGVPLLVDLAAMRSAVSRMGRDAGIIEPLVPVDPTSANSAAANKSSSDDFHALKPATTGPSCA